MNEIDNDWLTPKQAAELVGVTTRTVQNWIKDGKVRGYQVVGRIRVKRSDVDALYQPKEGYRDALDKLIARKKKTGDVSCPPRFSLIMCPMGCLTFS